MSVALLRIVAVLLTILQNGGLCNCQIEHLISGHSHSTDDGVCIMNHSDSEHHGWNHDGDAYLCVGRSNGSVQVQMNAGNPTGADVYADVDDLAFVARLRWNRCDAMQCAIGRSGVGVSLPLLI